MTTEQKQSPPQMITILSVGEPEERTGRDGSTYKMVVCRIKHDDKDLEAVCWRPRLFDTLKSSVGKTIKADIEFRYSPDGEMTGKINNLFVDGQVQQGRRSFGRSPEERASIEAQCALKAAVDLIVAEKAGYENKSGLERVALVAQGCYFIIKRVQEATPGETGKKSATIATTPIAESPPSAQDAPFSPVSPDPKTASWRDRLPNLKHTGDAFSLLHELHPLKRKQHVLSLLGVEMGEQITLTPQEMVLKCMEAWGEPKAGER